MKRIALSIVFVGAVLGSLAQSKSYQDLKRNFGGQPEVRSFGIGGPACRLLVNIIGHDDPEVADALAGVKHVRLMTIPMEEFDNQGLSVRGFRSRLTSDNFELLASFRDSGSDLALYHRPEKNIDRYFVLIEEDDELTAVEMKGFIDPAAFKDSFSIVHFDQSLSMKQFGLMLCLILGVTLASAQTKTTEALDKESEGLTLFFYKNTLRMLNQSDSKEFDEMIKDIEKMRFLLVDRVEEKFGSKELQSLKSGYKGESYEEVMSSRLDGRNFEVYVRESGGDIKGTVVLASDSSQLFVLDILGKIAINKVPDFFNSLDDNTDIGKKIKEFMDIADH